MENRQEKLGNLTETLKNIIWEKCKEKDLTANEITSILTALVIEFLIAVKLPIKEAEYYFSELPKYYTSHYKRRYPFE